MQRCVDAQNHVVDPVLCPTNGHGGGGGGGYAGYHFYYGGRGNYAPGSLATDGSTAPAAGHSYSVTNGTARGGFGSSFGGGGEGGEGGAQGGGGAGE